MPNVARLTHLRLTMRMEIVSDHDNDDGYHEPHVILPAMASLQSLEGDSELVWRIEPMP